MLRYESQCVDCTAIGLPCRGSACPYSKRVPVHYCDNPKCRCELEEIYIVDGQELCEECLKERFKKKKEP